MSSRKKVCIDSLWFSLSAWELIVKIFAAGTRHGVSASPHYKRPSFPVYESHYQDKTTRQTILSLQRGFFTVKTASYYWAGP